jgi:hypothetical protein
MIAERGLFGIYEYRVVTIDGDYLNLQPVSAVEELPDHARAACWPGVSGCSSEPELGSSVLVAFVNGDRGRAVVAGYIGPDGEGHVPAALIVDCADIEIGTSTGSVRLAGARTPPGARVICEGDSVVVGAESGAIVLTTQYNPALGRAMS